MVGVLKALRVEKSRYHQELQDYRKEAAETLRSQTHPRIEIKRPELPKELEVLLVDAVQKNQNRKQRSAKQKKSKTKVLKSSEAVWKDVSNVLDSSEKHLPIAEKYFKRVFDLIQNPDSLLDGQSLWNEEDENVHEQAFGGSITLSASEDTLFERSSGEPGRKTSSASDTGFSSRADDHDQDQDGLGETFQPIIIDHTKGQEEKKKTAALPKGKGKGRKRSVPTPKLPTVEVKRENAPAEDSERTSRNLQTTVNANNLDQKLSSRRESSDSGGVPSSATEIRRKAQEFLVELDLLQNLGSNLQQTKVQVRKPSVDAVDNNTNEKEEEVARQQQTKQPQYASIASSPIVVTGDRGFESSARTSSKAGARDMEDMHTQAHSRQQSISVQASLQDVSVDATRVTGMQATNQKTDAPTTSFFSDVIRSGNRNSDSLKDANLLLNQEDRLLEGRTSFSVQQEKADIELYKKLGIDSYDTASKVDKIFADSTVSPAMEVVERLLGGQYDYQAMYLECSVASQRLDKIKADMRETPISTLDFETNFDEALHDSKDDFEVSKNFVSTTLEDLFADRTMAIGSTGGQETSELEPGTLLTDFYDIPKHLQRVASSQHGLAFESGKSSSVKPVHPKSTGKYDHIKSKLTAAATVDNSNAEGGERNSKLLKSSTTTLIEKLKTRERPRAKKKIEMPRKDSFAFVPTRKRGSEASKELQENLQVGEAEATVRASLMKQPTDTQSDDITEDQEDGPPEFSPEKPRTVSVADLSYNKSRYQSSKRMPVVAPAELAASVPLDPRQERMEERIKKLEEMVEQKNEVKSIVDSGDRTDERIDSEVQTDLSSHVEQSVQTSPEKELVEVKAQAMQKSGGTEAEYDDGEEVAAEDSEPPLVSTFDAVTDVAIEDIVPGTEDASSYPRGSHDNPLSFDGENEDFAALEDQVTFKEIQTQFKQEITLDNVVEEIIGRILSEKVEADLQQKKIKEDLSSDEINEVVHTEISKLYRSAQTSAEEAAKYTDDFNEMFLAHATIVALLKQETLLASNADAETSIENLEFTESPPDQAAMRAERRQRGESPRSAWERESGGRHTTTAGELGLQSKTSLTATRGFFDAEESISNTTTAAVRVEVSGISGKEEGSSSSSSTSPAYYSGSKSSDSSTSGGGFATPPTPATPRSYDEVMSSVESKMKVFEQGASAKKSEEGDDAETTNTVVRKLDLQEEESG